MTQRKFTLTCPQCGATAFKAPSAKPGPDDPLTCARCGAPFAPAAVKERIERQTRARLE